MYDEVSFFEVQRVEHVYYHVMTTEQLKCGLLLIVPLSLDQLTRHVSVPCDNGVYEYGDKYELRYLP